MAMSFPDKPLAHLLGANGPIHALAYSASPGTYILTGSADRTIRLYNPFPAESQSFASSSSSSSITGRFKQGAPAAPLPEGRLIQSYAAHGYEVLSLATYADAAWRNEEFRVQAVLGGRETFVVAGDELTAAGAGGDGRVWAWELLTGKLMAKVTVPWGPPGSGSKKRVLGRDGKEKERSNVISCLAWKDDGWGPQFCAGGTSGVATVFGPSS
ncbi:Putative T-complex protein 1 subunit eta [Verticillium dahliae VDG1]|nr:Putative T-complex protein 1 subunit eta [Verticillium dahliae VDG1]